MVSVLRLYSSKFWIWFPVAVDNRGTISDLNVSKGVDKKGY
jgi:hypothetical protein